MRVLLLIGLLLMIPLVEAQTVPDEIGNPNDQHIATQDAVILLQGGNYDEAFETDPDAAVRALASNREFRQNPNIMIRALNHNFENTVRYVDENPSLMSDNIDPKGIFWTVDKKAREDIEVLNKHRQILKEWGKSSKLGFHPDAQLSSYNGVSIVTKGTHSTNMEIQLMNQLGEAVVLPSGEIFFQGAISSVAGEVSSPIPGTLLVAPLKGNGRVSMGNKIEDMLVIAAPGAVVRFGPDNFRSPNPIDISGNRILGENVDRYDEQGNLIGKLGKGYLRYVESGDSTYAQIKGSYAVYDYGILRVNARPTSDTEVLVVSASDWTQLGGPTSKSYVDYTNQNIDLDIYSAAGNILEVDVGRKLLVSQEGRLSVQEPPAITRKVLLQAENDPSTTTATSYLETKWGFTPGESYHSGYFFLKTTGDGVQFKGTTLPGNEHYARFASMAPDGTSADYELRISANYESGRKNILAGPNIFGEESDITDLSDATSFTYGGDSVVTREEPKQPDPEPQADASTTGGADAQPSTQPDQAADLPDVESSKLPGVQAAIASLRAEGLYTGDEDLTAGGDGVPEYLESSSVSAANYLLRDSQAEANLEDPNMRKLSNYNPNDIKDVKFSIIDALNKIGVDSSKGFRADLYRRLEPGSQVHDGGLTAAQNTRLLNELKAGTLFNNLKPTPDTPVERDHLVPTGEEPYILQKGDFPVKVAEKMNLEPNQWELLVVKLRDGSYKPYGELSQAERISLPVGTEIRQNIPTFGEPSTDGGLRQSGLGGRSAIRGEISQEEVERTQAQIEGSIEQSQSDRGVIGLGHNEYAAVVKGQTLESIAKIAAEVRPGVTAEKLRRINGIHPDNVKRLRVSDHVLTRGQLPVGFTRITDVGKLEKVFFIPGHSVHPGTITGAEGEAGFNWDVVQLARKKLEAEGYQVDVATQPQYENRRALHTDVQRRVEQGQLAIDVQSQHRCNGGGHTNCDYVNPNGVIAHMDNYYAGKIGVHISGSGNGYIPITAASKASSSKGAIITEDYVPSEKRHSPAYNAKVEAYAQKIVNGILEARSDAATAARISQQASEQ